MRVLVVSANRERFPEPLFPIGPAYLASALLAAGLEVGLFDAGRGPLPLGRLARLLRRFAPDAVALSLRNADSASWPCTVSYAGAYRELARSIRGATGAPLILGGPAFSIFPEELLGFLEADWGFAGDGEAAVPFISRGPGRERIARGRLESLDTVGLTPALAGVLPGLRKYGAFGVQTARGCPHRCLYCTYPRLEGGSLRKRTPEAVAEEMRLLGKTAGAEEFFIVDSVFNASEDHMAAVLEAIAATGPPVAFSCYMTPRVSDPGVFRLLAEAGCVGVDFGTDSGSPAVLAGLRKSFSVDDVRHSSQWCRRAGIDFCHSLLFGGPGETVGTIGETTRLMDEVSPRAVIAMAGLRVYPGTGLEALARREGAAVGAPSLLAPSFYFGGMRSETLWEEVSRAASARGNWFLPGRRRWGSSPLPHLFRLLHRGGGPLWRRL